MPVQGARMTDTTKKTISEVLLGMAAYTVVASIFVLIFTKDKLKGEGGLLLGAAAGVRTQLYTEQKKFKAKMNYADKIGVPYVVFLGDDEVSAGVVACKDMVSGEQTTLPFDETLQRIREGLALREQGSVIVE